MEQDNKKEEVLLDKINNDTSDDLKHATTEPHSEEPKAKIAKKDHIATLSLSQALTQTDCIKQLAQEWSSQQKQDYKHAASQVEIFREPFQIGVMPDLLASTEQCQALVNEIVEKVVWSRKQMDLYEFYQSTDLSNLSHCSLLSGFLQLLRRQVRPWLEKLTNLKLDYVSASCSMYTSGDYLLVHDDLLKDRQVAFIYYLSPWPGAEQWTAQMGGCLEIFNSNENCFPEFPVRRKIAPKNNQFAFFKVGCRSFHQVGEVTCFDYPRLTINGWFHGASNDDIFHDESLRPFNQLTYEPALQSAISNLVEDLINEVYLKQEARIAIQKRIEDNSEICLYEFCKSEIFQQALQQLLADDKLQWQRQGPANAQNYEILNCSSASAGLKTLIQLFGSQQMFALLRDYTDLDLAGANAKNPSFAMEFQRWTHGNYTVLGDGAICEENTLDLVFYLNASPGAGVITYLAPEAEPSVGAGYNEQEDEEDSVLLTLTPVDNALNIIYRCEGTTKFTKYVSHNSSLDKGPVFVISCSYKE